MINFLNRINIGVEVLPLSVEAVDLTVVFVAVALQRKVGLGTVGHGVLQVLTFHHTFLYIPEEMIVDLVFHRGVDKSYEEGFIVNEITGDERIGQIVMNAG